MTFNGERLRQLREGKPWSRIFLAKKLNVSDPQIGRWESGRCVPRAEMIDKLAKIFHVPVSQLIEEKEAVTA